MSNAEFDQLAALTANALQDVALDERIVGLAEDLGTPPRWLGSPRRAASGHGIASSTSAVGWAALPRGWLGGTCAK